MFTLRRIDNGEQRVYKERVGLCAPARKFGSRYTIPAMAESRVAIDDWRLAIGDWRLATVGSKRILNSSCVGSCAVDSELGDSINVNVE